MGAKVTVAVRRAPVVRGRVRFVVEVGMGRVAAERLAAYGKAEDCGGNIGLVRADVRTAVEQALEMADEFGRVKGVR